MGQRAGWGLADMGIVIFVIVKQLLVLAYLTAYLNVPIGIAGMVTTGVLIFDIITDPLVGYFSDKTQSRWGRRSPWMFLGALILAGGTVGLFSVPADISVQLTVVWVSGFFGMATIGFTMVAIPYGATVGGDDPGSERTFHHDGVADGVCQCGNSCRRCSHPRDGQCNGAFDGGVVCFSIDGHSDMAVFVHYPECSQNSAAFGSSF